MAADSEQLRIYYENIVKHNPTNVEAVHYLALWHFERQSFQQAKKFFNHLASLRREEADVWLCLCACYAFSSDHADSLAALNNAKKLINNSELDVRVRFCYALLAEKRRDFGTAMEGYTTCLNQCNIIVNNLNNSSKAKALANPAAAAIDNTQRIVFLKEIRGEILLRMAVLRKEMGDMENSMQLCSLISSEQHGDVVRANALCLKGLLLEIKGEFPVSEVIYRSVLQIAPGHCTALERLGRVYLRFRETIPAAVQCFFKAVETNPSNHVAWYLLGRCYMATSQYSDAWEAYNRAINLNPNDAQVWCSLGVLYYAFGQYREALGMLARALKLDPTMADAWYNVGALYDMCDQPDDAQQAYIKARENGLADRFAKAGMGLNPLSMQTAQYMSGVQPGVGKQSGGPGLSPHYTEGGHVHMAGPQSSSSGNGIGSGVVDNVGHMSGPSLHQHSGTVSHPRGLVAPTISSSLASMNPAQLEHGMHMHSAGALPSNVLQDIRSSYHTVGTQR